MRNDYPVVDVTTLATTTYDEDGFLTASLEVPAAEGEAGADAFELHHPYGFASRPPDSTATDGCQIGFAYIGSAGHAIAFGDTRKTKKLASLKKGESMQYGPTGNFIRCHEGGEISMFTSSDPKGDVQTDKPSVFFQVRPNAFRFTAPWGRQWFDNTGFHVFHTSGAQFHMGQMSGLPAPFDQFTSYADIKAATIRLATNVLDVGNNPLTKDHLAHVTPVLTVFQQLANILTTLAASPTPSPGAPLGAAIAVPLTALQAYLAALVAEGPMTAVPTIRSASISS